MARAQTGYAKTSDGVVAYEVRGGGATDVLYFSDWVIPLSAMSDGHLGRFVERLASFSRLLLFDRRGTGQSDPVDAAGDRVFESWVQDAIAVLDEAGSEQAVILGGDIGGQVALSLAARHPERVRAMVLANTCARFRWASDHPIGAPQEAVDQILGMVDALWGSGYPPMAVLAPSMVGDEEFEAFTHRVQRAGATPRTAKAVLQASADADLRPLLGQIRVPTVVLHSRGDQIMPVDHGRHLAAAIAGARFVELPGSDHPVPLADADGILDEVEHVVVGKRATRSVTRASVAVLMSDIVGSTALAADLGDVRWRARLDQHDRYARARVRAHRGTLAKLTGDGVLARFPTADAAIACGLDLAADCRGLGLSIRSGVHVGDVELRDDGDIAGLHVHVAARIAALAGPDEILLSEAAAADVADGRYEPRGDHALRGVPGRWTLVALRSR